MRRLNPPLTPSEKLFLYRRRNNWTQQDAAKEFGVSLSKYSKFENNTHSDIPDIDLNGLMDHEYCVIKRRRAGLTQAEVASEIKRCRWWVHQMETGTVNSEDLTKFWELVTDGNA